MHNRTNVQFKEVFTFVYLLNKSNCYEEASDPKECIDCKISCWYESWETGCSQNVKGFHPIFDVHESKPHVMSENNPENGQYPHSIEDEQVLVLGCFGDSYDFLKIIFEGEALEHFYPHAVAFGQPVNN